MGVACRLRNTTGDEPKNAGLLPGKPTVNTSARPYLTMAEQLERLAEHKAKKEAANGGGLTEKAQVWSEPGLSGQMSGELQREQCADEP